MANIRSEKGGDAHRRKRDGPVGAAVLVTAALLSSMGNIPARKEGTVPSDGYLITKSIPIASKVTGVADIESIRSLSLIRCGCDGTGYMNATKSLGPFSIQLNLHLRTIERDGRRQEFWVQDVLLTEYSKSGRLEDAYHSEIFRLKSPTELIIIRPGTIKGNGSVYNNFLYNLKTKERIYDGNTYIYTTGLEPVRFPLRTSMSVETHISNGLLRVDFEYSTANNDEVRFDSVNIGKRGEYRSAYIYATSGITDASFGIGGGGDNAASYLLNIRGSLGMYAEINGINIPVRYGGGVLQTAEPSINMAFELPVKSGMVGVEPEYKY
jgi:hypothetical protein